MKTPAELHIIADAIAEDNSDLVEKSENKGQVLAKAIRDNFATYVEQEQLTAEDKKAIFGIMYDNDFFRTEDEIEQSYVTYLELRTMMQLCGVENYTIKA